MSIQLHMFIVYVKGVFQPDTKTLFVCHQISSSAIGIKIRVLQTEHDTPGSSIFTCTLPRKYMTLSISGGILRVSDLWSRSYWKDSARPFACFWTKSSGTCQFVRADKKGLYFIYVVLLCYIYINCICLTIFNTHLRTTFHLDFAELGHSSISRSC